MKGAYIYERSIWDREFTMVSNACFCVMSSLVSIVQADSDYSTNRQSNYFGS